MLLSRALSSVTPEEPVPLNPREAVSGILGSISLACWIFLLVRSIRTFPPSDFRKEQREEAGEPGQGK